MQLAGTPRLVVGHDTTANQWRAGGPSKPRGRLSKEWCRLSKRLAKRLSGLAKRLRGLAKQRLVEKGGLGSERSSVGPAKVDTRQLGRLNVTSQLAGGHHLPVGVLVEAKAGLGTKAEGVGVAVVYAAGNKTAQAGLTAQLKAAGKGWSNWTVSNLK